MVSGLEIMFTGIIEHLGTVQRIDATPRRHADETRAYRLTLDLGPLAEGLPLGASVAVNGTCLTLAAVHGTAGDFDVIPETWSRSTLRTLQPGHRVNLERALRAGDRLDGHFVQGHVDAVSRVLRIDRAGGEWRLWIAADAEIRPLIVPKGSVAIDGTSLTVADVGDDRFAVALVPTTLQRTVLQERQPGDLVNVETDLLVRAVLQGLATWLPNAARRDAGITLAMLQEGGFAS